MFITFEGLDLSGKSTQARLLASRLEAAGRSVRSLREPGGTPISERLRTLLLDRRNLEMTDTAELLLFAASRAQLVAEVILPALRRGEIVICDRYADSTTAYQGHGRGLDLEAIRHINALATAHTAPDLTLLIDVPAEEVERRQARAGLTSDRMESAGRAFYERVRRGYLQMADDEPGRFIRIDGMMSIEEVQRNVWHAVQCRGSFGGSDSSTKDAKSV